ncbi:acyl-CoA dehydrogenase family protein [Chloroflexota bacterium]
MIELSLSQEQEMLRAMARDFVNNECPKKLVRELEGTETGFSVDHWHKVARLGWQGLVLPKKYGGAGASLLDLVMLLEETGHALLPSPYIPTMSSALMILYCGSDEQKSRMIPAVTGGELVMSPAITDTEFNWEPESVLTEAASHADYFILNGTKLFVPLAKSADYFLCAARSKTSGDTKAGISLFLVAKETSGLILTSLNGYACDHFYEIRLENVKVPKTNLLGKLGGAWHVIRETLKPAAVMLCAELVGSSQAVVDMTVKYAKERRQFGQTIGSFQRVQDRIINMVNDLDRSRLSTYEAAWRLSKGLDCDLEVSVAKLMTSQAYDRICLEAHHVFAGLGYMQDCDLHLYTKKAKMAQWYLGDAAFHRGIISRRLGMVLA